MTARLGPEHARRLLGVAAQHQHVVDAEVVQVKEHVFGFLLRKAAADYVWHSLYFKALHQPGADAHRTGTLPYRNALHQAVGLRLVDHFLTVVGHIHKGRLKLHQRLDGV